MKRSTKIILATTGVAATLLTTVPSATAAPTGHGHTTKPTIVLVHGAWADGSSWSGVTQRLQRRGYTVDVVPNPLRGLDSDSTYLKAYLGKVTGPIVLVGHSYGGAVITNAATGNAQVRSLVYVDAFVPDAGETVNQLTVAEPGSRLAVEDASTVFNTVPIPDGGGNPDLYVKQDLFPEIFAGGVRRSKAAQLAAGQRPLAGSALSEKSGAPAWKTIPSWDVIGTADQVIPPAEQEVMAQRAKAHVVRIKAPHLSMVDRPTAVTDVIISAARAR